MMPLARLNCVGIDIVKPPVVYPYLFHWGAAPVYSKGENTSGLFMTCFYLVELSPILIIASFKVIKKGTVSVNFTHTSKKTFGFQLLFFQLMAQTHAPTYTYAC